MAVSPVSAQTAGFDDVPRRGVYYATPVEELNARGVFEGTLCEDGFCPGESIDRKTVAVWLVRVIDGQDPPPGSSRFPDVNSQLPAFWPPFIERLAELDVTRGCGDGTNFCPNRNVTRAEMAAFLSRAYNLPDGPDPGFSDVPDDAWYKSYVTQLAASGITVGCKDGTQYCPGRETTRAQMATFLYRASTSSPAETVSELDVLGASGLMSVELQKNIDQISYRVYYCGSKDADHAWDMAKLTEVTDDIRDHVNGVGQFFQRESSAQSNIDIVVGGLLWPDEDWDDPDTNLFTWLHNVNTYWKVQERDGIPADPDWYADPCGKEIEERGDDVLDAIILADVANTSGQYILNGYAYNYGRPPAVVAVTNDRPTNDPTGFLWTTAHEIGHASYGWQHAWISAYPGSQKASEILKNDLTQAAKLAKQNGQFTEELHWAESVMSYVDVGAKGKQNLAAGRSNSGHVACGHKKQVEWVEQDTTFQNCTFATPPAVITQIRVSPGDRSLSVAWRAPSDRGAEIRDYHLAYRAKDGGSGWIAWQPEVASTETTTEIGDLTNGITYELRVRAENDIGVGRFSDIVEATPSRGDGPEVTIRVGDSAQGAQGADGICTSPHCRWLHIEVKGFGPGQHTLACAHNGVHQRGFSRGVYNSAFVSDGHNNRTCLFGYPGNSVFVIVGGERRGDTWYGGTYSKDIDWPYAEDSTDPPELRISWGSDASNRQDCPANTECRNLNYEYIGDWPAPPYSVECWGNGQRAFGPFDWSGRPHTGCYSWGGTTQVVINGIRSNTITFPSQEDQAEAPDRPVVRVVSSGNQIEASWSADDNGSRIDRWEVGGVGEVAAGTTSYVWRNQSPGEYAVRVRAHNAEGWSEWGRATVTVTEATLRISWGSDASNRQDCPANTECRNLNYEYIGDWPAPPYSVECWGNGQRAFGPFDWSGRPHTGCYSWGGTTQVVINGIRSNTITFPE